MQTLHGPDLRLQPRSTRSTPSRSSHYPTPQMQQTQQTLQAETQQNHPKRAHDASPGRTHLPLAVPCITHNHTLLYRLSTSNSREETHCFQRLNSYLRRAAADITHLSEHRVAQPHSGLAPAPPDTAPAPAVGQLARVKRGLTHGTRHAAHTTQYTSNHST